VALVLAANEVSASGHEYDDRTGISYEFPVRYQRLVQSGERFVYYRGRGTRSGRHQPQVYLGVGIVGEVHAATAGRLRCDILDYRPFDEPLFFRSSTGSYYEPAPARGGYYWMTGVRLIDDGVYGSIVEAASAIETESLGASGSINYQSNPEIQRRIEQYAVSVAVNIMGDQFPDLAIQEQPRNNPGFDLLIGAGSHYCEVKGTAKAAPVFLLSEGERVFSLANSENYTLVVVYGIDLEQRTHFAAIHRGGLNGQEVELKPVQWAGTLRAAHHLQ
jgi:hypothetical protein